MSSVQLAYYLAMGSSFVVILPAIAALWRWRKLQYPSQYYLGWFSLFTLVSAAVQYYFAQIAGRNTMLFSHTVPIVDTALYLGMFAALLTLRTRQWLFVGFLLVSLTGSYFYPVTSLNIVAMIVHAALIVGISIYFFAREMQQDTDRNWWFRPIVWIAVANLSYYACSAVYYFLHNWLVAMEYWTTMMQLSGVHGLFSIFHTLLLTVALCISPPPSRSPSSSTWL